MQLILMVLMVRGDEPLETSISLRRKRFVCKLHFLEKDVIEASEFYRNVHNSCRNFLTINIHPIIDGKQKLKNMT